MSYKLFLIALFLACNIVSKANEQPRISIISSFNSDEGMNLWIEVSEIENNEVSIFSDRINDNKQIEVIHFEWIPEKKKILITTIIHKENQANNLYLLFVELKWNYITLNGEVVDSRSLTNKLFLTKKPSEYSGTIRP